MSRGSIYVGIDLHKRSFSFVMLSESGEKLSEGKRSTSFEEVCDFASQLGHHHHIALEPLDNCYWFMDQLPAAAGMRPRFIWPIRARCV